MKHSIRYVQVKVEIDHDESVDPDDVINECDYRFRAESRGGTICETELQEISETPFN
jgi:hypothetical protein